MAWWRRGGHANDGTPREVDVRSAAELTAGGAVLLDVRQPGEWSAGRAPRARHIPLGRLEQRLREVPTTRTVLTICRSGSRSAQAARRLRSAGYTVINVRGGMRAWEQAGLPVVAAGGRPGHVA